MKTQKITLLLDSARGHYIPRDFVQCFDLSKFKGIAPADIAECQNPENAGYWDAWESILNCATYSENGRTFTLHQDSDLWLVCVNELSEKELSDFFGG